MNDARKQQAIRLLAYLKDHGYTLGPGRLKTRPCWYVDGQPLDEDDSVLVMKPVIRFTLTSPGSPRRFEAPYIFGLFNAAQRIAWEANYEGYGPPETTESRP